MGQGIFFHDSLVPLEILPVLWLLKKDKVVRIGLEALYSCSYLPVTGFIILESKRLLRIFADTENPSALLDELLELGDDLRSSSGDFYDEEGSIFLGTVAELALPDSSILEYGLADIVGSASCLVDGLPDEGGVGNVKLHRERFGLHAHGGPHVVVGRKDGDVGVHVRILELACKPGTVVIEILYIGPPGVPFVVEGSVLDPTRELSLKWRIVESVPH